MGNQTLPQALRDLLDRQWLGALSTHRDGQPYGSLVAFAASADGKTICFVTPRATRKYENLSADTRASMLIDSRTNTAADLKDACACTAMGKVNELEGRERDRALSHYLERLPQLRSFAESPSCALLQLQVVRYVIVCRFQNVTEYCP